MKHLISLLIVALLWTALFPANAQVNVTQEHNNPSRDGHYIDAAFTPANAANLTRDLNFDGTISGHVYAQPLYIEGGPSGPMIIAVTESNNVYALHADTGLPIWSRTDIGTPAPQGACPGNIIPVGITGTPVVDLASRSLFFDAVINGNPVKHFIFSLNVDTGATNAGWPVDVDATAQYNGVNFDSFWQEERGALALVNGIVYVSYSGYVGDCGPYHGWVVGVDINSPSTVMAWATDAEGGGIWGHGGVASDGTNMFVVTGNTFTTSGDPWRGGEAIVRFSAGPLFSDFWAPTNWFNLDQTDTDLGGCSATVIDVPGANPSQLVLALGKDHNAYLLDRNNLGGVGAAVATMNVSNATLRGTSSAAYRTAEGTHFAFHTGESGELRSYIVNATSPPTMALAWNVSQGGRGSPWVTTTDGTNNAIVWVANVEGDGKLYGFDGDNGAVIFNGGGPNEIMSGTRQWNTGMVARGRIYFGADNKIYAFKVPTGAPTPTPSPSGTPPVTPTPTPSATPPVTPTPSGTPPATATPTATVSPTPSATPRGTPRSRPTPHGRPTPHPRP
jgi:cell division septation protein DedD